MSPRQRYRSTRSELSYGAGPRGSLDTIPVLSELQTSRSPPSAWGPIGDAKSVPGSDWRHADFFLSDKAEVSELEHARAIRRAGGAPREASDFKRVVGAGFAEKPCPPAGERGMLDSETYIVTMKALQLYAYDLVNPSGVAQLLQKNTGLRSIDLSGAETIQSHTVEVLCAALEEHPSVQHLDLHGLPAHPRSLSSLLARNSTLRSLDLYSCFDPTAKLHDGRCAHVSCVSVGKSQSCMVGSWVRLKADLHEQGELVAEKGALGVVCAVKERRTGTVTGWRLFGAAVDARQLKLACYSGGGRSSSVAVLASGLAANTGLRHLNLALGDLTGASGNCAGAAAGSGGAERQLLSALRAHPTLHSFNAVPLRYHSNDLPPQVRVRFQRIRNARI